MNTVYEVGEDGTCVEVPQQPQLTHRVTPDATTLDDSYARQRYADAKAGRLTMRKSVGGQGWTPWRLGGNDDNTLTGPGASGVRAIR